MIKKPFRGWVVVSSMVDVQDLLRLDAELITYVEDVFSSLRRKGP